MVKHVSRVLSLEERRRVVDFIVLLSQLSKARKAKKAKRAKPEKTKARDPTLLGRGPFYFLHIRLPYCKLKTSKWHHD